MDSFIIAYIENRMKALGIPQYQFEPYCIVHPGVELLSIAIAPEEYYYLTSRELKPGTFIMAANNYYTVEDYYDFQGYSKLQEFHGPQLRIESPRGLTQVFEFIRVVTYPQ